jgi:outer membrane protein assembly factor BamB
VWKTDRPPIATSSLPYRKAFSTPLIVKVDGVEQMVIPGAQWMVSYNPADGTERWRVDTGGTFSNTARPVCGHGMAYVGTAYGGTRLLAIRLDGRGDVTRSHVVWETRKQVPKKSSPLLIGDELYFVSDLGVANCVDAKTGEIHWSERLSDALSASPVYADGRVYVFGEQGTTTVLQPGKQPVKLAENSLDGRILASPAVVDGAIFLRTDGHLYRIGER